MFSNNCSLAIRMITAYEPSLAVTEKRKSALGDLNIKGTNSGKLFTSSRSGTKASDLTCRCASSKARLCLRSRGRLQRSYSWSGNWLHLPRGWPTARRHRKAVDAVGSRPFGCSGAATSCRLEHVWLLLTRLVPFSECVRWGCWLPSLACKRWRIGPGQ